MPLYLLTYDTSNGHIKVLCLNRDTMSEVIRYNAAGKYYDTETKQICLAYAYATVKPPVRKIRLLPWKD